MTDLSHVGVHRVAIVVDRDFGAALSALASQYHVWIVESPQNAPAIRAAWAAETLDASVDPLGPGVTAFEDSSHETAAESCRRIASEVDEHHGELAHEPPWSEIRVVGVPLDPELEAIFRGIGAVQFRRLPDGFVCYRIALAGT